MAAAPPKRTSRRAERLQARLNRRTVRLAGTAVAWTPAEDLRGEDSGMGILYDYHRSSACFRVRIALRLKGVAYET